MEGLARGTVLALKGKTKEEVKQYLDPDTYTFFSEFSMEKVVTTTTITTTMTKRVKVNTFKNRILLLQDGLQRDVSDLFQGKPLFSP